MFNRPNAPQPQLQTLSQLREELEDLNETIALQKESIENGGGIIGLEMAKAALESYEKQKTTLEADIQQHPEYHPSCMIKTKSL